MIEQLRLYWTGRSAREQRLLLVMFALLAVVIVWFGIISPLQNARLNARARLEQATLVSGKVASRASALIRARRTVPPPLGTSLAAAIGASATEAGFVPSRLDPQAEDRVAVAISSAKSTALFTWLETLSRRGIFVEKITIRSNSDATLGCDMTLRLRRP